MKPIHYNGTTYFIYVDKSSHQKVLGIEGDTSSFQGELNDGIFQCPLTQENAAALRERLPWLKPQPLGLAKSFGCLHGEQWIPHHWDATTAPYICRNSVA